MEQKNEVKLFDGGLIRSHWAEEISEWYFSVVDVVEVLTESADPTDYLRKLKKRDKEFAAYLGTNCPKVAMVTKSGKKRKVLAGTPKDILRIIQSIPSKKAEPFKLWLAQVGSERLDENQDPELTIERAFREYAALGYTDEWINQRLQAIQVRKDLTDEWKKSGVHEGLEYAVLTNLITSGWSGKTVQEYKKFKGLKKENLRDNMTTMELVLNMLAEATTSELHKSRDTQGFSESQLNAKKGAEVAKNARQEIEQETKKPIVSSENAKELQHRANKEIGN
ncbi:MAG: Bro-N domain-containing protein [Bifidobacteriaceae bacterium]|jgi:hypothetical protein|nr:Bro-N domain-containing protein [Bifidobacteriaceae bacterium]